MNYVYMTVSREPAPLRMARTIVEIQAMASVHMCGGSHTTYWLLALQGNIVLIHTGSLATVSLTSSPGRIEENNWAWPAWG